MELIAVGKVQDRGQITLPFRMRSLLNLKSGEEVIITAVKREIIIKPKVDIIDKIGMLGKEKGVKTIKELVARYKGF